jgi:hypothetical protein
MSDPKDVVGKADAFLGRYRPGAAQDVPVLTDVVEVAGASPAVAGDASKPGVAATPPSEAELRALERQVTQRVLEAIQPALSGLVEKALGTITEQCRAQLDAMVRDALAKALEREMQQLREPRPPGR